MKKIAIYKKRQRSCKDILFLNKLNKRLSKIVRKGYIRRGLYEQLCKNIKKEGESCTLNNNCTFPDCKN